MSLDLWLQKAPCKTCNHYDRTDSVNITYNLSPMWNAIFKNSERLIDIDGVTGRQSLPVLTTALSELSEFPEKFKKFNPENGWGSYEGLLKFIGNLIEMAGKHPNYIWHSCR